MRTAMGRFLQYLRVERNASDLTVKSYREDLTALADYLTESRDGHCPKPSQDPLPLVRRSQLLLHLDTIYRHHHRCDLKTHSIDQQFQELHLKLYHLQ